MTNVVNQPKRKPCINNKFLSLLVQNSSFYGIICLKHDKVFYYFTLIYVCMCLQKSLLSVHPFIICIIPVHWNLSFIFTTGISFVEEEEIKSLGKVTEFQLNSNKTWKYV